METITLLDENVAGTTNGDHEALQKKGSAEKTKPAASNTDNDTPEKVPADFTEAIYQALTKSYANKNPTQMFCLNWPATILDYENMSWAKEEETAGNMPERSLVRSSLILDQYVPPAPITQPDGTRVSDRYRQAVRQLAPLPNKELIRLQSVIRNRLQKKVKVEINGKEQEVSLMTWFDHLNKRWVDAKKRWGNEQQKMKEKFKAEYQQYPDQWYNEYLNWYSLNADSFVSDINNSHDELLAEFPATEWEDAIAILNTSDGAALKEAKALIKNATMPIPYQEGIDYTPTTGIPYSWVKELAPTTKRIDLLSDPEAQKAALDVALDQIQQEIQAWMAILPQISNDTVAKSADAFGKAQDAYSDAQKAYGEVQFANAVEAVKIFCDIMESRGKKVSETTDAKEQAEITKEVTTLQDELDKSNGKGKKQIDWKLIKEIAEKVGQGNSKLMQARYALVNAGRALAGAATKFLQDSANQSKFSWLDGYIKQLEFKLTKLLDQQKNHSSAANTYYKYLKSKPSDEKDKNPFGSDAFPSKYDFPENVRWTEMVVHIDTSQLKSEKTLNTFFNKSQWGVDLFLGGYGSDSETSGADFAEKYMEAGSQISIGFLAAKVMIQRPWMKPEIFNNSDSYFRTVGKQLSPEGKQIVHSDLMGSENEDKLLELLTDYSFPAYPVAMLLAKDVVVKVKIKSSMTERLREVEKSVKSQGGGFFCFSISNTDASESENESLNSYFMAGQMICRAPAPQILGYWVQFLPPDRSEILDEAKADEISKALGFLTKLGDAHDTLRETKTTPSK